MNRPAHPAADAPTVVSTIDDLVVRARALAARGPRTILGVVGAPGAGKSTVCAALEAHLGGATAVVGMDGFHLDDGVLLALGRRRRKGAPDTFDVPGYASLLRRLRDAREEVTYAPRFDRALEASRGSAVPVPRSVPLVLTEGNYLLHDGGGWAEIRPLLDEVWFLDVPAEERQRRLVGRRLSFGDSPSGARAWVRDVDEANASVVLAGRDRADVVVRLPPVTP
jgi:pantothenate kinase